MPFTCCVPNCRGNYKNGPKVRVYLEVGENGHDEKKYKLYACSDQRVNATHYFLFESRTRGSRIQPSSLNKIQIY